MTSKPYTEADRNRDCTAIDKALERHQEYDPTFDNVVITEHDELYEGEPIHVITIAVAEPGSAEEANEYFDTTDKAIAEEDKQFRLKERKPVIDHFMQTLTLEPSHAPFLNLEDTLILDFVPVHFNGFVEPMCVVEEGTYVNTDYFTYNEDSFVMRLSNELLIFCCFSTETYTGSAWLFEKLAPRLITAFPLYNKDLDKVNSPKFKTVDESLQALGFQGASDDD